MTQQEKADDLIKLFTTEGFSSTERGKTAGIENAIKCVEEILKITNDLPYWEGVLSIILKNY